MSEMPEIYYTNKRKQLATLLGEDVFIGHETGIKHFYEVINSGELRPGIETKNIHYGDGTYPDNFYSRYIYFAPYNKKLVYNINSYTFLFRINILQNKSFYMNPSWMGEGDDVKKKIIKFDKPIDELSRELNEMYNKKTITRKTHAYRPEILVKQKIPLNQAFALVLNNKKKIKQNVIEFCKNNGIAIIYRVEQNTQI